MQQVKNALIHDKWEISQGDYTSAIDYSNSQNKIRKKEKLVRTIILSVTVTISLIVFIIVLNLLTKINAV